MEIHGNSTLFFKLLQEKYLDQPFITFSIFNIDD